MTDIPSQTRELAERAFAEMPPLTARDNALLVIGLGSGALLERILEEYGHELSRERHNPRTTYIAAEWNPTHGMPIWVVEPDAAVVEKALEIYDWSRAIEIGQLRFFVGPNALDELDQDINYPFNCRITTWVSSHDTSLTPEDIQQITTRVGSSIEHRLETSERLAENQRNRLRMWRDSHPGQSPVVKWRERYTPGRRLKILVGGVRFGGFVGESSYLLARALERLGHDVHFLTEINNFQYIVPLALQRAIEDISPDLIVWINFARPFLAAKGTCMDGIPFCCYIQDPPVMDDLRSPAILEQKSELDFYVSCSEDWAKELEALGYGETPTVKAPTDPCVFSMASSSESHFCDREFDISYVATIPDDAAIEVFGDDNTEQGSRLKKKLFRDIYHSLEEPLANWKDPQPDDYRTMAVERVRRENPAWYAQHGNNPEAIRELTTSLENGPGRVAVRGMPLVWLAKAGHDLAVFGRGWEHHPDLMEHFQGWIPYGSPLAGMLRASKIHLCIHNLWTLTMKVLDCLATGTFPLVRAVPPERESGPITDWYQEDRDIVLFRTREELLDKARYYLDHADERRKIAMRGREITLQNFTYEHLAARILSLIRSRFGV